MEELRNKVKHLLETKEMDVFIGYGKGTADRIRAVFLRDPEKIDELILDERCNYNLATYLLKHEIKHFGKIGILATVPALRTIMILSSEHQVIDGELYIIGITPEGKIIDLPDFKAVEDYLATLAIDLKPDEKERIDLIDAMSMNEKWDFWAKEFSKCFKCYACRQSCPMCYCTKCTVDHNQPQWIAVPSHDLGNLEWHLMRAMHLAGRCINCGECAKACPMEIPLNLLTYKLIGEIKTDFNNVAGMKSDAMYVLSTFKPDDKENFML
jgi:formate dehydrogenase (coenzyme F420) beta subunit